VKQTKLNITMKSQLNQLIHPSLEKSTNMINKVKLKCRCR